MMKNRIKLFLYYTLNRIKRFSYYTLIGFIILILIHSTQFILPENSLGFNRRLKAILGYFVYLPTLSITTFFGIVVLNYYLKHKFKLPKKYFLITLPFLIYFI